MSNFEALTAHRHTDSAKGWSHLISPLEVPIHTMDPFIEIAGEPIVHLRHVDHADAFALTRIIESNREDFAKYFEWTNTADIQAISKRINKMLHLSSSEEGMAYCIVKGTIEEDWPQNPGGVIGLVRLFNPYSERTIQNEESHPEQPAVHYGFWLDKDARRLGIVPRACRVLGRYAAKRWGIKNIFMDIARDNAAAQRCAQTMGAKAIRIASWEMEREYNDPGFGPVRGTIEMDKWLVSIEPKNSKIHSQELYDSFL